MILSSVVFIGGFSVTISIHKDILFLKLYYGNGASQFGNPPRSVIPQFNCQICKKGGNFAYVVGMLVNLVSHLDVNEDYVVFRRRSIS